MRWWSALAKFFESGLSKEAQVLLGDSYRAQYTKGKMFRSDRLDGTIIHAGNTAHQGFEWELALKELVEKGFAQRTNDILYELTIHGVEEAALLSATQG
jgi:hypothetical protein